jgi:dTDP-4-amino-4,6-dideoxygalactose transaminase
MQDAPTADAIPLLDLRAQHASIRGEVLAAVAEVLESQVCIHGPKVAALERAVAAYAGCAHGVGVSSGTDGLLAALMALGVGPGDEVVTTPFTFFATAGCAWRLGARPVFADIDPATFNIDPGRAEAAITPRTRAIVPVHLFGQAADMDPILDAAGRRGVPVVEDAAQAIGATYRGRRAGSMGAAGVFSFFPSKNLGAAGDAGMVVTNDGEIAARLATLRDHGMHPRYHHRVVGGNFRLDAVQAAVLLVKLPRLDAWSAARRENADYYSRRFDGTRVVPPAVADGRAVVANQYVVRVPARDRVREELREAGVGTEVYYPVPLHLQECFRALGHRPGDFPEAERAAAEVLALPVFPELGAERRERVADALLEAVRKI